MKRFTNSRKFLFGLSVSMVLAMAIGSFALGESQTQASPQAVGATAGAFTVIGGTQGTDYDFTGTSGTDGVLKIHPQSIGTNITISNTGTTTDRIEVTSAATITLAGVNIDRSSITTTEPAALTITDNANFDVKILLADNTTNILKGAAGNSSTSPYPAGSPGIEKNGEGDNIGTLTIGVPDSSQGTGTLEATGGRHAAGIGGGDSASASNITITGGEVTATGGYNGAGIGGGYYGSGSNITITGGVVAANGGYDGAGIGGGYQASGSDITITGGEVTANGGDYAAGIGSGAYANTSDIVISGGVVKATGGTQAAGIGCGAFATIGSDITISGGEVTATGGDYGAGIGGGQWASGNSITIECGVVKATGGGQAAGIGGGPSGSGSNITINGGVVTATGGTNGAGIGGGKNGSGSGNSLNGDAVVLATSGDAATKPALEGFENDQQESLLTKGIAFTGLGTAFDSDGHATDVTWDANGSMYGNVTLSQDLEIPANLTIPAGQILSIKEGKEVTLSEKAGVKYTVEGELQNNGTVTLPADLAFNGNGKVTTKTDFYLEGSTDIYTTGYQTYQTSAGVQKYTNLPNPDNSNGTVFNSWFTKPGGPDGGGTKVDENTNVLLNDHNFYEYRSEEHEITITQPEHGTVTTDPENPKTGDEVIITVTPEEGYEIDGLPIVKTEDGRIIEVIPTGNPNEYKFIMPDSDVTIEVNFVLISEPTVDPDVKTGDSFAGIAALAILGLATTGAVLVRKRK